jgi:hypothetical protein
MSELQGRGDLFSEGRKALPHSMERQCGLDILHSTAPEDSLGCNGHFPCLSSASIFTALGAFDKLGRICVAAF